MSEPCTLDRDGAARRLIGHHLAWLQSALSLSLSLVCSAPYNKSPEISHLFAS